MLTKKKTTTQLFKDKHINPSYNFFSESDSAKVDPSYKRNTDNLPSKTQRYTIS